MDLKQTVTILGTEYSIVRMAYDDDFMVEANASGLCDGFTKTIYISDMGNLRENQVDKAIREVARHEVIHAYLTECGLCENALVVDIAWPLNEEMVDWFALMLPRINKTFAELGIAEE